MNLRTAAPTDAPALNQLFEGAFLDYVAGIGRECPGPYDWMEDRIAAGHIVLAEKSPGSAPLGAIIMSDNAEHDALVIDMLAVSGAARGSGVGQRLLEHAEVLARTAERGQLTLHTVAKYDHLVRYYERAGFALTHLGSRPKGDDGHPRAFMAKTILSEKATR